MKTGDLVKFWIPSTSKSKQFIGLIVGIKTDNLSITGRGEVYEVLTPEDGILRLTLGSLETVK